MVREKRPLSWFRTRKKLSLNTHHIFPWNVLANAPNNTKTNKNLKVLYFISLYNLAKPTLNDQTKCIELLLLKNDTIAISKKWRYLLQLVAKAQKWQHFLCSKIFILYILKGFMPGNNIRLKVSLVSFGLT